MGVDAVLAGDNVTHPWKLRSRFSFVLPVSSFCFFIDKFWCVNEMRRDLRYKNVCSLLLQGVRCIFMLVTNMWSCKTTCDV